MTALRVVWDCPLTKAVKQWRDRQLRMGSFMGDSRRLWGGWLRTTVVGVETAAWWASETITVKECRWSEARNSCMNNQELHGVPIYAEDG